MGWFDGLTSGLSGLASSVWEGTKSVGDFIGLDGSFGYDGKWSNAGQATNLPTDLSKWDGVSRDFGGLPSLTEKTSSGGGFDLSSILGGASGQKSSQFGLGDALGLAASWYQGDQANKIAQEAAKQQADYNNRLLAMQQQKFNADLAEQERNIAKEDEMTADINSGFYSGFGRKKPATPTTDLYTYSTLNNE